MDFLNSLYLPDMLHTISEDLIVPVVVLLVLFVFYSLYSIGALLVEVFAERRHYRACIPELLAQLNDAKDPATMEQVIEKSGLLRTQKDDLLELIAYFYLPQEARTEIAKRLLANEDLAFQKTLGRTDAAAKVAPMLGLMGTLIPLGPGLVALGTGETALLADAMLVAFDTTVAGLATAVVCYIVSRIRRGWYSDYLVSMEAVFNTLLEHATQLHEEGCDFPHDGYEYNNHGTQAKKKRNPREDEVAEPLAGGLQTGEPSPKSAIAAVPLDASSSAVSSSAGISPQGASPSLVAQWGQSPVVEAR